MPTRDCSPTKPKFSGKLETATTQPEKITHITASQVNKILFDSFIVHRLSRCSISVEKGYEHKILTQNK
jgi:hypothetical protein